jgi:hypothetical protein
MLWRVNESRRLRLHVPIFIVAIGLSLAAVDRQDGEVLVVSNVSWRQGALSFNVHVPSNRYRTEHVFRLGGQQRPDQ